MQNTLDPLRVIYRRAMRRDLVAVDPTEGLELRRPTGRRDRIAAPSEAAALLAALPDGDRALWATAMYAGLRRGELQAPAWRCVQFEGGGACQATSRRPRPSSTPTCRPGQSWDSRVPSEASPSVPQRDR